MNVEQSVEWDLAGETEVLQENLLQCHFTCQKLARRDVSSNPGLRRKKPATNRLSYGTAR
jgi:hypothetical protein